MKTLYRPLALLSVISLILASTFTGLSVSADSSNVDDVPGGQLTRRGLSGTVIGMGSNDFVLETKWGNVTIDVSGSTIIKSGGEIVEFDTMKVGDRAGVLLDKAPDAPGKGDDDDGDDPDVAPVTQGDDTGVDLTPVTTGDDTGTEPDVDLTPTPTGDDTGTDPDVTPTPTATPTATPEVTPPATNDDTGTEPDSTPTPTPTPDLTVPASSADSGTDIDLSSPSNANDSGTDMEPSVTPVPTPAPSFRQNVTALRISIVPAKATRSHKCGVVTDTGDGTTTVLNEDGTETELEGDEGTEGEDVCLITKTNKGGGKQVTGSTGSSIVDDRLARLAKKNADLAERLAEKQAEVQAKRDARLENTVTNAPDDKRGKAQGAKDKNANRGSSGSGDDGGTDDSGGSNGSGSGNSGNSGGGNSGNSGGGNSGNSGGGNSGNSGGGNSGNSGKKP